LDLKFAGKLALVPGATAGIGFAITRLLPNRRERMFISTKHSNPSMVQSCLGTLVVPVRSLPSNCGTTFARQAISEIRSSVCVLKQLGAAAAFLIGELGGRVIGCLDTFALFDSLGVAHRLQKPFIRRDLEGRRLWHAICSCDVRALSLPASVVA
jgi:hypothetical protein